MQLAPARWRATGLSVGVSLACRGRVVCEDGAPESSCPVVPGQRGAAATAVTRVHRLAALCGGVADRLRMSRH